MKKLLLKNLPKLFGLLGLFVLGWGTIVLAVGNSAPPGGVPIESDLAVANVTAGQTTYHDQVSAKVDDVVKFEIWYHNPEPEDSGKIANNVNVKIVIPDGMRKTHTATSTVGGSNTNTETKIANVNTEIETSLDYIPGTAYRRYNTGTNAAPNWQTVKIPDVVTTTGYVISSFKPCWNFQETITIQARVKAPVFTVDKYVKKEGGSQWLREMDAQPGDKLAYMIAFKNVSNVNLTEVLVKDSFPPKLDYVEGSAVLTNGSHPNGMKASDNLVNGGTFIGSYSPGAAAYVRFNAMVPKTATQLGCYTHNNVANIDTKETGWVNNNAKVRVCYKEKTPPVTPPKTPPKGEKISSVSGAPTTLPVSGPAEAAVGFGAFTMAGSVLSYIKTKKGLKDAFKK